MIMVVAHDADESFAHTGEIELQEFDPLSHSATGEVAHHKFDSLSHRATGEFELQEFGPLVHRTHTVSVPASDLTTPRSRRPASPTLDGPNKRFQGAGRDAEYLRAVRNVLLHLEEESGGEEAKQEPGDSQREDVHAWLLAFTQSVPHTSPDTADPQYSARYGIPRSVSRYLTDLRTHSRDSEIGNATRFILGRLKEDRKREEQEMKASQVLATRLKEEAKLLGYWI